MARKFKMLLKICLLNLSLVAFSSTPSTSTADVDINKYLGTWHQIATIPMWFQRNCVKDTYAQYEMSEQNIKVTNYCTEEDGSVNIANGQARLNPQFDDPSKLEVTFISIFGMWLWFLSGDYWILDLESDYSISIVGDPKREYLWILSRTPTLNLKTLTTLNHKIKNLGYDTCLIKVTQNGDLKNKDLCKIETSS